MIKQDEHSIQVACVSWFRWQHSDIAERLFAVPNGGRRDATTGAKLKAEGVLAGVADLILLLPSGGYGALLIEMKKNKGKQSPAQKHWENNLTKNGEYKYVVCHSVNEFIKEVEDYINGN